MTEAADDRLVRANAALVQRVWSDESFRERLKRDPRAALAEAGMPVPDGTEVVVLEDTPALAHLVLPRPATPDAAAPAPPADAPALQRVLARAVADAGFRERLAAAPADTLRAEGVPLPEGVEVRAVEDGAERAHLVLPCPPPEGEVGDEALLGASGGTVLSAAVSTSVILGPGLATATSALVVMTVTWKR